MRIPLGQAKEAVDKKIMDTMPESDWNKYYQKTAPAGIPWNKSPDDYLVKLLRSGKLGQGTALDLGCGVGRKSILLAKKGFEVTGVDISREAIRQAKANAKQDGVKVKFFAKDATNLSFLGNEKFNLILDWANLHGILADKQQKYVGGIARHARRNGKFVLRCFNKTGISPNEIGFLSPMGPIMIFSKADIKKLFSKYFKIVESRETRASHLFRLFSEYLMERR